MFVQMTINQHDQEGWRSLGSEMIRLAISSSSSVKKVE